MLHLENGRRRRRKRRGVDFAQYAGDWRYVRDELGVDSAGLLQKAEEKAAEYGVPDPGEAICLALRHVRGHYDPTRGPSSRSSSRPWRRGGGRSWPGRGVRPSTTGSASSGT
jgi:hypothetical protein